jgi:hypothetical protein
MAEENNLSVMQMMGKSWLDYGKIDSLDKVIEKIEKTEAKHLMDLANDWMSLDSLSSLKYIPSND